MSINYDNLPGHMQDTARRYIEHGISGGSFFTAVVSNDLMNAFGRADEVNRAAMWDWCNFFYNNAPSTCWGSPAEVEAWIARGGMNSEDAA